MPTATRGDVSGAVQFQAYGQAQIINRQERKTVYFATDFGFDSFNWKTQFLYKQPHHGQSLWRQFFRQC